MALIYIHPDKGLRINPDEVSYIEVNKRGDVTTQSKEPGVRCITGHDGHFSATKETTGETVHIDLAPAIIDSAQQLNIPVYYI